MTREEAIEHLKNMAEHSYPNEEYLMAIKALGQEPILDKIRAEIEQLPDIDDAGVFSSVRMKSMVLQIIDKYKAESEE